MARLNLGKVLVTLEGEHDSSRAYDKYCEVTSGGSSYVSKKPVPIGTLITDTAFWQLRASKGADGQDGTDGNDGLDAYQPFKGWYSSTSELNTSFGTPQVGDYAYIKGATANDPVAIYQCVTAGSWTDSGRTFNPSNNQEFASGQSLNTVNIVDNLTSSSATDVLSAKQGKELKGQIDALGPKIDQIAGSSSNVTEKVISKDSDGYIDKVGDKKTASGYAISTPIQVSARSLVLVGTSAYGSMSAVCFTDAEGSFYKPYSFGYNDYSVHNYAIPILEDGYIAIVYNTQQLNNTFVKVIEGNTFNDLCNDFIGRIKSASVAFGGTLSYLDFNIKKYITSAGQEYSASTTYSTDYVQITKCNIITHGLYLGHPSNCAIAFYTKDKVFIRGIYNVGTTGGDYTIQSSDIPANAFYAKFSAFYNAAIFRDISVQLYKSGDIVNEINRVGSKFDARFKKCNSLRLDIGNLTEGSVKTISFPNTKWNYSISVFARVTTMGTLTIKHGNVAYNRGEVSIDGSAVTYMTSYNSSGGAITTSTNHGLSISNFIYIRIDVKEDNNASITLTTNGGTFTQAIKFFGSHGNVSVETTGGSYTNVCMYAGGGVYKRKVWVFGDSYLDFWPKHTISTHSNYMLDGYSGRNSSAAISSLELLKSMGTPDTIVWAMGMNDIDNGAINTSWATALDELKEYCQLNEIELILVTIPSTPTRDNSYKNARIRSSGYRYIDIEQAVGADISTSWYSGYLSADSTHPTTAGAKIIAERFMTEIPEMRTLPI